MNTENDVMRVVVLGGSFSPPTIAHRKLLQAAMDAVQADRGIFVPAPRWYVKRKLKKNGCAQEALPDELRLEMLETMCKEDGRLSVDDCEMCRTERGFTYETLVRIQENHPGSWIYFVAGSDKLHIIPRWHRIRELMEHFTILVTKRSGETPEQLLEEHPFLAKNRDAFLIFTAPEGLESISSSAVREDLRCGGKLAKDMVTKEVWELMKKNGMVREACIERFREEYDFLSNFYPAQVEYQGLLYENTEAAFQAQKCRTDEEKTCFCGLPPNMAKKLGRQVELRDNWEEVKVGLMEEIVRAKFFQNPDLGKRLLATGEIPLVEGNTWGDTCWGVDTRTGRGENHLGRILMKIRAELAIEQG
ncbi:nicotinate (nicotinamide) nucleotide adenylyltransferase [Diplocloster modestus]|uniref:Probable nicotinate-nucleotide adenylyltransferase n=1 Tax=Diplocloster modestus TaxID=2850322 RepID=A0ABS6KDR1_9FIRM|nr:nicotinate (nicotinamide) nucleotide adenylyltransferase [Diplocloster modestus]MBU9728623.1 nicotinate (nicotinamide) nucleotide adenylyltransferase [Diplocloster modestus]